MIADVDALRLAAQGLVEHACGYDKGRAKDDPVYVEVTEGRDGPGPVQRKYYSSCADLGHWLLWRLGVREPWVNRKDNGGWKSQVNISRLCGPQGVVRGNTPGGFLANGKEPAHLATWPGPELGDILIVSNFWPQGSDAHCLVALERTGDKLESGNYGLGGCSSAVSPGAGLRTNTLKWNGHGWFYGSRMIRRWLSLADVAKIVKATPDISGAIVVDGVLDGLKVES
jgi:hypothetical protein